MGAKNTQFTQATYLKLKSKTSDTDPTPFFGKNEKHGETYEITEKFNSCDGFLTEISSSTYEYEGETKNKVRMTLVDPDGSVSFVEANFNNLVYSLLNSLCGVVPEKVEMQVWLSKPTPESKGKRFANITVKNNGKKIGWSMQQDELPKVRTEMVGNKKIKVDDEVVAFWKNKILDIAKTLKSADAYGIAAPKYQTETATAEVTDNSFPSDNQN